MEWKAKVGWKMKGNIVWHVTIFFFVFAAAVRQSFPWVSIFKTLDWGPLKRTHKGLRCRNHQPSMNQNVTCDQQKKAQGNRSLFTQHTRCHNPQESTFDLDPYQRS